MKQTRESRALYSSARKVIPGGVSSPVRAYAPYPVYIKRGKGPLVYDVDGNSYVDLTLGYGPLIFGHAHPMMVRAIKEQVSSGALFGAPVELEVSVARKVRRLYPSMEMMRFTSTGAEAVTSALRLARAATGKNGVAKIDGGFHGSVDQLLVKAGSGAATLPSSAGVFSTKGAPTYLLPFNDLGAAEHLFESAEDLGLMIIEPVLGNMGTILPERGYLAGIRKLTREHGVLLAFDEVITGFRVGLGGAQERFSISPDLTLLGKVLGGGLPLAAYGGRKELMSMVAPSGQVYQAGTFSGNPLSLASAQAVLTNLGRRDVKDLEARTGRLATEVASELRSAGIEAEVPTIGSLFSIFLTKEQVRDAEAARRSDTRSFIRFARRLLDGGVFVPQSPFESLFLSLAHGDGEEHKVLRAVRQAARHVTKIGR